MAIVSDRGNDAHSRDDDTSHPHIPLRPALMTPAGNFLRRKRARNGTKIKN
ncbi:hypothetical protein APY04_2076 [Hyphomicrobium sulfonivorans]|uniref:Uncharacterized protein n=1 Tax=Hyphomicrobium sulfonivorans TaxID=121290 RepID=A0A109BEE6_HYPSL|nr:hypothetical protein APY04_2076 [Hyphomicrobium sulfonivorans]